MLTCIMLILTLHIARRPGSEPEPNSANTNIESLVQIELFTVCLQAHISGYQFYPKKVIYLGFTPCLAYLDV